MTTVTDVLEQAIFYHDRRGDYDRAAKLDAAKDLGRFGVFSSRQIGAILDLSHVYVAKAINKPEKTGGRFDPKALKPLLRVAQLHAAGEVDVFAVKEALDAGVTKYLASRLTHVPRTTLERRYAKATHLKGETV